MSASQVSALKQENEKLKVEVEQWKKKLFDVGAARGIREFSTSAKAQCEAPVKKQPTENKAALNPAEVSDKKETKKVQEKKPKKDTGKLFQHPFTFFKELHVNYSKMQVNQLNLLLPKQKRTRQSISAE